MISELTRVVARVWIGVATIIIVPAKAAAAPPGNIGSSERVNYRASCERKGNRPNLHSAAEFQAGRPVAICNSSGYLSAVRERIH